MNIFIGMGNLVEDAKLKQTSTDKVFASFCMAINRQNSASSERKEVDYINILVWGKTAENVAKYTHKGSKLLVEGRLQVRNYEKDGKKVYVTEVVASKVVFLSSGQKEQKETTENKTSFKAEEVDDDNFPFDF